MKIRQKYTVIAGIAVLLTAGCTVPVDDTPAPRETVIETAAPDPVETEEPEFDDATIEDLYLITVRDGLRASYPDIDTISDAELIDLGKQTCDLLNGGFSLEEIMIEVLAGDTDAEFAGAIMGAGIAAFCPEHQSQIDALG